MNLIEICSLEHLKNNNSYWYIWVKDKNKHNKYFQIHLIVLYLIFENISLRVGQAFQDILLQNVQFWFQFFFRAQKFQMHRVQFGILHFKRVS